ncbi:MAG: hypothetical protein KTR15_11200 [Phycisphaeraceae bacterium]|nr:hypothetical protein [Phycisphaeraceae bacterium]
MTKQLPTPDAKRSPLRWSLQGLLAVSAIGLGVAGVMTQIDQGNPVEAQVQEPAQREEKIGANTYYAIQRLRSELKLTHRDLVSAGCDTAVTHEALTSLLGWYEVNKSSLYEARNELLAARKALYEASPTTAGGKPTDLIPYVQAVAEAQQVLEQVKAQAIGQAELGFTETQRQRLAAARTNTDITGSLRYIHSLSKAQKRRITEAQSKRSTSDAVLSTAGLSYSQQQDLAAMRRDTDQRSLQVAAGEATALPVPASIQAEIAAAEE